MINMSDHLDSKSLIPFRPRRNGYHLPGMAKEVEEEIVDQVDPDLQPEEKRYIRHYLTYADTMLKSTENQLHALEHDNVTEIPRGEGESEDEAA